MANETPLSAIELGADAATKKIIENTAIGLVSSIAGYAHGEIKKLQTRYKRGFTKYMKTISISVVRLRLY